MLSSHRFKRSCFFIYFSLERPHGFAEINVLVPTRIANYWLLFSPVPFLSTSAWPRSAVPAHVTDAVGVSALSGTPDSSHVRPFLAH